MQIRFVCAVALWAAMIVAVFPRTAVAEEARWIWSPEHLAGQAPLQATCYFRRSFQLSRPQQGQISIVADDAFELYVNGRRVAMGGSGKQLKNYDVSRFLARGRNTIAVKVVNTNGSDAGLAARVMVQESGQGWKSFSTDADWKTSIYPLPLWNTGAYNDRRWEASQVLGVLGEDSPRGSESDRLPEELEAPLPGDMHRQGRFVIDHEFQVRRILGHEETGSLVAMTFNEFGHILASRGDGPLLLIYDSNRDGVHDKVRTYCDQVTGCQGILALNGVVFVTSDGPQGAALYRLEDKDRDGVLETVQAILRFEGPPGEHGAHGLVLGPDGFLYLVLGNHTRPLMDYAARSPYRNSYEGDLLTPRYEDPGGHAVDRKAPGGVIIRTDAEGRGVELIAGGLRNAYDLAFSADGELFVHDSDMESDIGASWYRPTQVLHIVPGGEYGWRSGWAKFPEYFLDNLPAAAQTGRGSPTGMVCYQHYAFPARYHNALFLADWSQGRILAARPKAVGASFQLEPEVFMTGTPLNVCDVDVGPDGALYFITGGRDTHGGLYRVSWTGEIPEEARNRGKGLVQAMRQPQAASAWGRQQIATLKQRLGEDWSKSLQALVYNVENSAAYRVRALELMQLFGPAPTRELLLALSRDEQAEVRGKAVDFLALQSDADGRGALVRLLADKDPRVRRRAAEALIRAGQTAPLDSLKKMLASTDRFEAWAARRLLEVLPVSQWREETLSEDDQRIFLQGALALMIAAPDKVNALAVVESIRTRLQRFVTDQDFLDFLRVAQVCMIRGQLVPAELAAFRDQIVLEYPAQDAILNREIVRHLAFLQASAAIGAMTEFAQGTAEPVERLHVALCLRFMQEGWTEISLRRLLLAYRDLAQREDVGGSYAAYIRNVARDFGKTLSPEQATALLADGLIFPDVTLGALYRLPEQLPESAIANLVLIDRGLEQSDNESADALRVGVVAILARTQQESALQYLQTEWERSPDRRPIIALGLAQYPSGQANWSFMVRSLPILDGAAAREVITRLMDVQKAPVDDEHIRQLILLGLRLQQGGAEEAAALLTYWTGEEPAPQSQDWRSLMAGWQQWWVQTHPDSPPAELPSAEAGQTWDLDQLREFLATNDGQEGSTTRGAEVFAKAQCAKCHRFGKQGESMGPDLSTVANRFSTHEILESILFPSQVISDQYAAKNIITADGRSFTGILAPGGQNEMIVLQSSGQKVVLSKDNIEETSISKNSAMPAGLLNDLTLQEIADLFAYLGATRRNMAAGGAAAGSSRRRR